MTTVFIISAPSGSGKSTLVNEIRVSVPGLDFSISYTTRKPRGSEKNGREYHFVSRETFEAMIARGEFLEWADVFGNYYGTAKCYVHDAKNGKRDLLLDIDVQGAKQVRSSGIESTGIFVLPPSADVLEQRLRGRSKDSEEAIQRRLAVACQEVGEFAAYKYVVINDELDAAVERLRAIVLAERARMKRMRDAAETIIGTFRGKLTS